MTGDSDLARLRSALSETGRFVYRHAAALVGVSVAWFVASLPLVTIGPATLGAYAAIRSLRETGRVDRGTVAERLRANGVHALLLGALPIVPALAAGLYAGDYLASGTALSAALTVACAYAALYAVLVLVPAFVSLSDGATVVEALRFGRTQVTGHPTLALTTALLTLTVLVATVALTVGFVLLFPAVAFSLHLFLFDFDREDAGDERGTAGIVRHSNRLPTEL
ncbi:hypothetical protein [Halomarina pelagica]|uniref:hypothetical protein n=1 Tax=Halomarina pelagica TaxID=2961599 RepID=UPI0020C383B5|nr:hypothetical protein [Halomarina sp. BND7]